MIVSASIFFRSFSLPILLALWLFVYNLKLFTIVSNSVLLLFHILFCLLTSFIYNFKRFTIVSDSVFVLSHPILLLLLFIYNFQLFTIVPNSVFVPFHILCCLLFSSIYTTFKVFQKFPFLSIALSHSVLLLLFMYNFQHFIIVSVSIFVPFHILCGLLFSSTYNFQRFKLVTVSSVYRAISSPSPPLSFLFTFNLFFYPPHYVLFLSSIRTCIIS